MAKKKIKKTKKARLKAKFLLEKKIAKTKSTLKKKIKLIEGSKIREIIRKPKIKIIGIGGGGSSIVSEIASILKGFTHVDFVAANTDLQALKSVSQKIRKFAFGQEITGGLGCGMNPKLGEMAAQKAKEEIQKLLRGTDLAIFISCLGGGAGSGAAPEFAKIAKESKIMTFGIFTLPFRFEGKKKLLIAKNSLKKLFLHLNALVILANENVFRIVERKTPLQKSLSIVNQALAQSLEGLIEMIYSPGLINIDFADLRTILNYRPPVYQGKLALIHSAQAQGPNRIEQVIKKILFNPLTDYSLQKSRKGKFFTATNILFNIVSSKNLKMKEVEQICKTIFDLNKRAKIIFGISYDQKYKDKIKITLLATGRRKEKKKKQVPKKTVKLKKIKIKKVQPQKVSIKKTKVKIKSPVEQKRKAKPLPLKKEEEEKAKKEKKESKIKKERKIKKKSKIKKKKIKKKKRFVSKRKSPQPLKKKRQKQKSKKQKKLKARSKKSSSSPSLKSELLQSSDSQSRSGKEFLAKIGPISEKKSGKNRKNALDLRREIERAERKILEEEEKWIIPAFLRRKK